MPKVNRKPKTKKGKTTTQSFIFPKDKFTKKQALAWLRSHGHYTGGLEETGSSYRARQYDPKYFSRFRTMALGSRGIKAVVAVVKAQWTTAYVNGLPDSAFLYIAPGGKKDTDGKTVPRSLRKFPYKDDTGRVDLPHLRNAIARIPRSNIPVTEKKSLQTKAKKLLEQNTPKKK